MGATPEDITVLHVDDDPDFVAMAAEFLEAESGAFTVHAETDVEAALERLHAERVDCVVSDYDMPDLDGIGFLEAVRETAPDLPFILFTGKGSEAVASDAISAGVSDYLQKEPGSGPFAVLANRIENAVARRRAEAAVETTQHRYRRLIEKSSDVIFVVAPSGRLDYVSPAAGRVLGYEPEALVGEIGFDYVHPDDREAVMATFGELLEDPEREPRMAFRFDHGDGQWRWLEVRGRNLLDDPDVSGVVVYARDVTDRKVRERELARVRDRMAFALETTDAVVYELALETMTETRHGPFEALYGVPEHEVVELDAFYELAVHPEDRATLEERQRAVVDDEADSTQIEYRTHPDAGPVRWIRSQMAHVPGATDDGDSVIGLAVDVTAQKEREQALRDSEERYRQLLATAPAQILVYSPDGDIRYANEAAVEFLGAEDRTELLGRNVVDLVDAGTRPLVEERMARVIEAAERLPPTEETLVDLRGESKQAIVAAAPIRFRGERAIQAVATDVTELKEREAELERQVERLDEFASIVSHDLRNPLGVARGRLELAREDLDHEDLERADEALDRMAGLIDDLLALARHGDVVQSPEPVALAEVAEQSWQTVSTEASTVTVDTAAVVRADRSRLRQLLENLINNAVEHGSTGHQTQSDDAVEHGSTGREGAPHDAVEHAGPGVAIRVGDLEDGFFVEDDGPGIPPDRREAVFEHGHSTVPDGNGFGLTIVEQIAEAHDWDVRVTDGIEGGARIEVTGVEFVDA